AIGWGKEPTAIGPLPLTQWIDGADVPSAGRNVGFPLLSVNADDVITVLHASDANPHGVSSGMDLNALAIGQYLAAPPTRTNAQLGPLMTDSKGNLLVTQSTVTTSSKFTSAAYEASHASAGAKTLRAAFVSS